MSTGEQDCFSSCFEFLQEWDDLDVDRLKQNYRDIRQDDLLYVIDQVQKRANYHSFDHPLRTLEVKQHLIKALNFSEEVFKPHSNITFENLPFEVFARVIQRDGIPIRYGSVSFADPHNLDGDFCVVFDARVENSIKQNIKDHLNNIYVPLANEWEANGIGLVKNADPHLTLLFYKELLEQFPKIDEALDLFPDNLDQYMLDTLPRLDIILTAQPVFPKHFERLFAIQQELLSYLEQNPILRAMVYYKLLDVLDIRKEREVGKSGD